MSGSDFEAFLDDITAQLTNEAGNSGFPNAHIFETRIRDIINGMGGYNGRKVTETPHPHVFPDIALLPFGIEIKHTQKDSWRSVANSVFETTRSDGIEEIYVIFGKMGGKPEVKWQKYQDCVMHVRTSHVPRFELEIGTDKPIFDKFGISYPDFQKLDIHSRMEHIRDYARKRLKSGERLWWLETNGNEHSLPLEVRMYPALEQPEKRKLRAEAALLCPKIVGPSTLKGKYDDAVVYLITYHGVFCPQARDLFTAGSVALKSDPKRGGKYIIRSLADIEEEMKTAAFEMEDALFQEYWGRSCEAENRISQWLSMADSYAKDWTPSKTLFQ